MQAYILVDSRRRYVKGYYRDRNGWQEKKFDPMSDTVIDILCVEDDLDFQRIYAKTSFTF